MPVPVVDTSTVLPAEVDVVVVGSGAAALTGAFTAAVNGLSVLVLEKTRHLGGTCAYAGAGLWFPGNRVLARSGVDDSAEAGLTYLKSVVGDRTPSDVQEAFVGTGAEVVEFLEDRGLEFQYLPFPDYYDAPGRAKPTGRSICPSPIEGSSLGAGLEYLRPTTGADKFDVDEPRDVLTGGQSLIGQLLLALDKTGNAEIRVESPMESLVREGDTVVGVVAAGGQTVRARRGVLVGAGGYDNDPVRRRELHDVPTTNWTSCPPGGNTGDALEALQAVGAAVDLLDEAWWCPGILFPNGRAAFLPIVRGGIFVGPDGRRFTNESMPYDQAGHNMLAKVREFGQDSEFWWVFDSSKEDAPGVCVPSLVVDEFVGTPYLRSADTVEGLAAEIGVSVDGLRETIELFNKNASIGIDTEFHRGEDDYDLHFGQGEGPNSQLIPIEHGPFRAVRVVLSDLGTKGGAVTGASAEVRDTDGNTINGLYAVGGSASSVAGNVYPGPGTPIGSGMVFAYRAVNAMLATDAFTVSEDAAVGS
ncbi:FAD-binding protein [Rhodococcus sp. NPDC003322]